MTAAAGGLNIAAAFVRAQQLWRSGQGRETEVLLRAIVASAPDYAEALHFLALITPRADAVDLLRRSCAAPGAQPLFFSNLAEACRRRGWLAEAEAAGRNAVGRDPTMAQAWNNLGIALQERGIFEESRQCLERAAALAPGLPEAHMNLGNTLRRLGRLQDSLAAYQRALDLRAAYAEAHSNLAVALCDLGQLDAAALQAAKAITLAPNLPDAYANAAVIESRLHRPQAAFELIGKALALAPQAIPVLLLGAAIYKNLRRFDDAERLARKVVALTPENGEAHHTLAQILHALGRYDEAFAAFDCAIPLLPQPGQAIVNRGLMSAELGKRDDAIAAFGRAIDGQPNLAPAWFNRANAKSFSAGDPDLDAMESLAASVALETHDDRVMLRFALGKAWLDAGDPARAFAHLHEGNRLKRAVTHYDGPATVAWMANIAAHFPPGSLSEAAGGEPSDLPIFIIGMPRSGTTLVEQTLAAHAEIFGAGELHDIGDLAGGLAPGREGGAATFPATLSGARPVDFTRLGADYVARLRRMAPAARRVVDKMPANFLYAGFIRRILPNARIVHCRRDALDTCLSCYGKLFAGEQEFSYDLAELGQFYRGYERLMDHWRAVLPPENFIEIEYADMVGDFEAAARRLVDFCGLDWDANCLRFHESPRPVRTASLYQVRKPVYAASLGRAHAYAEYLAPLAAALAAGRETP